jgi:GNAT superfamily N-acetyltransferase
VAELLIHTRLQQMPYAPSAHSDGELHAWVEATLLPAGGVTLAERAGRIVGVLSLSHGDEAFWIDQLFVHPAHIGSGLGRELLRHALAVQGRPLRLWTFQANLHGRAFYEHHGFEAILTTDGSANEELCPDVLYERLAP